MLYEIGRNLALWSVEPGLQQAAPHPFVNASSRLIDQRLVNPQPPRCEVVRFLISLPHPVQAYVGCRRLALRSPRNLLHPLWGLSGDTATADDFTAKLILSSRFGTRPWN